MFVSAKTHKQEVDRLNKEKEELSQQLNKTKEELNGAKVEKDNLLSSLEKEKEKVSQLQETKQNLQKDFDESSKKREELSQQLNKTKEELNGAKVEKDNLLSSLEKEKDKVSQLQETKQNLQKDFDGSSKKKEELSQQLNKTKEELNGVKVEKDNLLSSLEKEKDKVSQLQETKQNLQKDFDELSKKKEELSQQLNKTKEEYNSKKELFSSNEERKLQLNKQEIENNEKTKIANRLITVMRHDLEKYIKIGRAAIIEIYDEKEDLDTFTKKKLKEIFYSLDRTLQGFNNIVERTKAIQNNISFDPTKTSMKDLVDDVINEFKFIAQYDNVNVVNKIERDLILEVDKFQMKVAMRNLILNGIEANQSIRGGEKGIVEITSITSDDEFYHIYILNSGHPIPKEIFDKVFKEEIKSSKGKDRIGEGSILIKDIVSEHKGIIEIKNPQSNEFTTSILLKLPK